MNNQTATYPTSEDIWNTAVYGFWYVVLQCMVLLYGVCMVYGYMDIVDQAASTSSMDMADHGITYHVSRYALCLVSGVWCLIKGRTVRCIFANQCFLQLV
jgi:hypothetical protein